jgi:hypothetical protein
MKDKHKNIRKGRKKMENREDEKKTENKNDRRGEEQN